MKNIFTRSKFLNERFLWTKTTPENREFIYNEVKSVIEEFMFIEFNSYAKSFRSGYFRENYKNDIYKLNRFIIDKISYDLKKFMTEFKSEIYSDKFFTEECGFLDALLYTYDQTYLLSGDYLIDFGGGDMDEHVIKYDYGYDMYDLGKKYLLQNYDTLEDFYYDCATKFWAVENEQIFNVDDFQKNQINFSTTDKLEKGSITILDVTKFFNLYENEELFDIGNLINSILSNFNEKKNAHSRNGLKPFNFKYFNAYDKIDNVILFIVGFGDVDLEDSKNYSEYSEKIELQSDAKKYNM